MDNNLYQQVILDHNRNPRNSQRLKEFSHSAKANNPLCGDQLELFLKVKGDKVEGIGFEGSGCAISQASISLMTEIVKGKTVEEIKKLIVEFNQLTKHEIEAKDSGLGKLEVFSGVWQYPARIKCASLGWKALEEALNKK